MNVTDKWREMANIYLRFAKDWPQADQSEEAANAMYLHETFGVALPSTQRLNAYQVGKKWMDVMVAMWKEDISQCSLRVSELQADGYPDWFLDRVGVLHMTPVKSPWWVQGLPTRQKHAAESQTEYPELMLRFQSARIDQSFYQIEPATQ